MAADLIDRLRGNAPSIPAMRDAADEIQHLRNQVLLTRAEADGAASLLLDVQKECIAARKALVELREYFKQKGHLARRETQGRPSTEADCYDHAYEMVAGYLIELDPIGYAQLPVTSNG